MITEKDRAVWRRRRKWVRFTQWTLWGTGGFMTFLFCVGVYDIVASLLSYSPEARHDVIEAVRNAPEPGRVYKSSEVWFIDRIYSSAIPLYLAMLGFGFGFSWRERTKLWLHIEQLEGDAEETRQGAA